MSFLMGTTGNGNDSEYRKTMEERDAVASSANSRVQTSHPGEERMIIERQKVQFVCTRSKIEPPKNPKLLFQKKFSVLHQGLI
jgi:hypothetical protein